RGEAVRLLFDGDVHDGKDGASGTGGGKLRSPHAACQSEVDGRRVLFASERRIVRVPGAEGGAVLRARASGMGSHWKQGKRRLIALSALPGSEDLSLDEAVGGKETAARGSRRPSSRELPGFQARRRRARAAAPPIRPSRQEPASGTAGVPVTEISRITVPLY
ncbi:MAG: hypothetical protein JWO82_993, partial [Akkermansiaceae bacterium]|nr:hypothetical protein [Akkermansiaceae bacterium]